MTIAGEDAPTLYAIVLAAGASSRFGAPVKNLGLVMAHAEMAALVRLVGAAVALEILLEGRIYDDLQYEVDFQARDSEHPVRDAFLNYRRFEAAEVRGGRFKVPFGRDQLTSVFANSFISRSLIGAQLSPGRDVGVMAHGRFFRRRRSGSSPTRRGARRILSEDSLASNDDHAP